MKTHICYMAAIWTGVALGSLLATGCDRRLEPWGHEHKSPDIPEAFVELRGNYWLGLTVILPRGGSPDVRYLPRGVLDPRLLTSPLYVAWPPQDEDGNRAYESIAYHGGALLEPKEVRRFVDSMRILAGPGDPKEYVNELQGVLLLEACRQADDQAQATKYFLPIYWYDNAFELWTGDNAWQFHNPVLADMVTSLMLEEGAITEGYREVLARVAGGDSAMGATEVASPTGEHEEYLQRNRLHYWPEPVDLWESEYPGPEHELLTRITACCAGQASRNQKALDTMLHQAIEHGMWRATQLCLLAGADPLSKEPDTEVSAMERAMMLSHHEEILCLMLIATPKDHRPDPSRLLLDYCQAWPTGQGIRMLVAAGADPDVSELAETEGWTPLHRSVQSDSVRAVKALLLLGATPTRSPEGKTLLEMAQSAEMRRCLMGLASGVEGSTESPVVDRKQRRQSP